MIRLDFGHVLVRLGDDLFIIAWPFRCSDERMIDMDEVKQEVKHELHGSARQVIDIARAVGEAVRDEPLNPDNGKVGIEERFELIFKAAVQAVVGRINWS